MADHVIDEKNLIPAMAYLVLIWELMGSLRGEIYTQISVVFENVIFERATHIPKEGNIQLTAMIQKGNFLFAYNDMEFFASSTLDVCGVIVKVVKVVKVVKIDI